MDILDFYESHSPSVSHTKDALQSTKQRLSDTLVHPGMLTWTPPEQISLPNILKTDELRKPEYNTSDTDRNYLQVQPNGIAINDDDFDPYSIDSSVFSALDNISDDWFGPFLADLIC